MFPELPAWAREMAWVSDDDAALPSETDGINVVLNRVRLAAFLCRFAEDKDVRDLLALDVLGAAIGLPLSSTGAPESAPDLALRPFRIWEYAWLYKSLGLSAGGMNVLDLGGPASHLSILAAIAGCRVTSVDINPVFVHAAQECARGLGLNSLDAQVGDMCDLSAFSGGQFDVVMCCSVLEHLTAQDQTTALREVARVLKSGGSVGLTFDFGIGAPGANEHLPPPHDPPPSAIEALRRYQQGGLVQVGNPFSEDPISGSLFRHESVGYLMASLFLAKPPIPQIQAPRCEARGSVLEHLVIRDLPYRIHRHLSSADGLRARLEAQVAEKEAALTVLEQAAAERLATMHDKDQANAQLRSQLDRALATIGQQHEQAAKLLQANRELEDERLFGYLARRLSRRGSRSL